MYILNLLDYFVPAAVKFILIGIERDRISKGTVPSSFIEEDTHEISDSHEILDASPFTTRFVARIALI